MNKPETPNLDKMLEVNEKSQLIGAFIDWLRNDEELAICEFEDERWWPTYGGHSGINRLLAKYYDVDYDGMERERRALLDWVRSQNEDRDTQQR